MPDGDAPALPEWPASSPRPDRREDLAARLDTLARWISTGQARPDHLEDLINRFDRIARRIKERQMAKDKQGEKDKAQEFLDQLQDEVEIDKITRDFLKESQEQAASQQNENG